MALATLHRVKISGVASAVPKTIVSNSEYEKISPEQREKIIKYTGIQFRRWGPNEVCCSDYCHAAGEKLLEELGWDRSEIGVVLLITQTQDFLFPATAQLLQERMGLPKHCLALDINLGCSGYAYGLYLLGALLESTGIKKGLMFVGDAPKNMEGNDPTTTVLFSQAACATAMEYSPDDATPIYFEMGSDGSGYQVIHASGGGSRAPISSEVFQRHEVEGGGTRGGIDLILDGAEIINFTLREIPQSVRRLMEYSGESIAETDAFIFHQANLLINKQVARKLGLKPEQTPMSLYHFGNTSSSTIPITLTTNLRERLAQGPAKIAMCGFGVGLSWASVYWNANGGVFPELVEV